MKKFKTILVCVSILLFCGLNLLPGLANPAPAGGNCNSGCSSTYFCSLPNQQHEKYMEIEGCEFDSEKFKYWCKTTMQQGFCCCNSCEHDDCPQS